MAAGADLDRVMPVDIDTTEGLVELILPSDLTGLRQAIEDQGDVHADPRSAAVETGWQARFPCGCQGAHRAPSLRKIAEDTGIIVVGIIHVNKSQTTDPLNSIMGSRAFSAVARFVHFVIQDPNDESKRLLGMVKNNLGPKRSDSWVFEIEGCIVGSGIRTRRVKWAGTDPRSIRQILQDSQVATKAPTPASKWLRQYLITANAPVDSQTVKADGLAAGFSERALVRTAKEMRIVMINGGYPRRTTWELPF